MRLIDVGCFNGDSVLHFVGDTKFDEILAFDPNDSFKDLWFAIAERYPQVTFYNGAIYTHNGEVPYTQRPEEAPLGSTIMRTKRDWGKGQISTVACYDILDFIQPDTVIKLDGEGSEYDILEHLIDNDALRYIPLMYIEWHGSKMAGDYQKRQKNILTALERANVKVEPW